MAKVTMPDNIQPLEKSPITDSGTDISVTNAIKDHIVVKDSVGARLFEDVGMIGTTLMNDIVKPGIKKMLYQAVCKGASLAIFKKDISAKETGSSRNWWEDDTYVNYNQLSTSARKVKNGPQLGLGVTQEDAERKSRLRRFGSTIKILFKTEDEAMSALEFLSDTITNFDIVCLSDLLEAISIKTEYTDFNVGWTEIGGASITASTHGFVLSIPNLERIKR